MSLKDKLKKITNEKPSMWKDKAKFRRNNPWLREYSSKIARRILSVIEDRKDLSQIKLAETLDVSPQQINKIVKGQENMTLETIYKLSKALDFELISFPEYKYSFIYLPTITGSTSYKELSSPPIDFSQLGGVYLHSITASSFEMNGEPNISIQANILNIIIANQPNG